MAKVKGWMVTFEIGGLRMIKLPWPDKSMHPNSRKHRMAVAPVRKKYRSDCAWIAKCGGLHFPHMADVGLHVKITFHPPDRRKRDLDGMLSAIKSGLDGIADVIGVDDSMWGLTILRGDAAKGGCVLIEVVPKP